MKRYKRLNEEKILLSKLITNEGKIINKKGFSVEGEGIFDDRGNEYITGYTSDGELYASIVDENNIVLNFNNKRTKFKIK